MQKLCSFLKDTFYEHLFKRYIVKPLQIFTLEDHTSLDCCITELWHPINKNYVFKQIDLYKQLWIRQDNGCGTALIARPSVFADTA